MSEFQKIIDAALEIERATIVINAEANQTTAEFNQMIDVLELRDTQILELQASAEKKDGLLTKQNAIIEKAMEVKIGQTSEITLLKAQLKELQGLDPKRLDKVNKEQKKTIAKLKTEAVSNEKLRKDTLATNKKLIAASMNLGAAPFHTDSSKNAIRVIPNLFIGDGNEFGGVPGTPVLEFLHHARGITRQGFLTKDGDVAWASAQNSAPSNDMTLVAKHMLLDYCGQNKIKLT